MTRPRPPGKPRNRRLRAALAALVAGVLLCGAAAIGWKWWLFHPEGGAVDWSQGLDFPALLTPDTIPEDTIAERPSPPVETAVSPSVPETPSPAPVPNSGEASLITLHLGGLQARLATGSRVRYTLVIYSEQRGLRAHVRPHQEAIEASLAELFYLTPSPELRITRMETQILERLRFLLPRVQVAKVALIDIQLETVSP